VTSPLQPDQFILEGVMTTQSAAGDINIAPMGPIVTAQMDTLILRPFTSSTTYRNLKETSEGVFHVTDDALLIAAAAIGKVEPNDSELNTATRSAEHVRGVVLTEACRYYEFRVTVLDDNQQRTRIEGQVIASQMLRPFFGFNRARHAVVEAAILATRLHLTGPQPVLEQFDHLQIPIDKTGSRRERKAMDRLRRFVQTYETCPPAPDQDN